MNLPLMLKEWQGKHSYAYFKAKKKLSVSLSSISPIDPRYFYIGHALHEAEVFLLVLRVRKIRKH
ncbi:hypothetical protein [Janthinobacterium sp. B9-8]|uniref:hypothetical protein n=1 Tax=Janthinobacterium sp. B9-8 TaxID=1236179 RepID=UPI00061D06D7|nr:hypothetical protein [Janthinobacterium sp. B9-8]